MFAIASRHRSLTLLAGALAFQVLLLAIQIRREQQVRLVRVWAVESVTPLGRAMSWITFGMHGAWDDVVDFRRFRQENNALRSERDQLRLRNDDLESRAAEADRLSNLLGFRDHHAEVPMLAARVISASPDAGSHIIFLSRGSRDGIRRDMGVITPDGVVGKVLAVYPDTSQVLLLNDKESGVGALLAGTRTQGPVNGSGDPLLSMQYISNDIKVQMGEEVFTSGQDRIFPKDLPVGTVVDVKPDRRGGFQQILVKPAAHLDQLEEVLVLLTRQEFLPKQQDDLPAAGAPPTGPVAAAATTPGASVVTGTASGSGPAAASTPSREHR